MRPGLAPRARFPGVGAPAGTGAITIPSAITCAPLTLAQTAGFAAGVTVEPAAAVDASTGALKSPLLEHAAPTMLSPIASSAMPLIPPRHFAVPGSLMT